MSDQQPQAWICDVCGSDHVHIVQPGKVYCVTPKCSRSIQGGNPFMQLQVTFIAQQFQHPTTEQNQQPG